MLQVLLLTGRRCSWCRGFDSSHHVHVDHGVALAVLWAGRHPGPGKAPGAHPDPPPDLPQATPTRWDGDSQWSAAGTQHAGHHGAVPELQLETEGREEGARPPVTWGHGLLPAAVTQKPQVPPGFPKSHALPAPGSGDSIRTWIRDRPGAASRSKAKVEVHRRELITLERVAKRDHGQPT